MKFFTYFAALATVAKISFVSAACGTQCNPKNVPNSVLTAKFDIIQKSFNVEGTINIENDCTFTVKGFKISPAPSQPAKWYAAKTIDQFEGILLTKDTVTATAAATDLSYNIKDSDQFCHASLLSDIGEGGYFRLMDGDTLIARAQVKASGSAPAKTTAPETSQKPSSSQKPTGATSANPTGTSAQPNTSSTPSPSTNIISGNSTSPDTTSKTGTKPSTSGAIALKAPSVVLYVALFILAFLKL